MGKKVAAVAVKKKVPGPKVKMTYSKCVISTTLKGLKCFLCGAEITPNVVHECSKPE